MPAQPSAVLEVSTLVYGKILFGINLKWNPFEGPPAERATLLGLIRNRQSREKAANGLGGSHLWKKAKGERTRAVVWQEWAKGKQEVDPSASTTTFVLPPWHVRPILCPKEMQKTANERDLV